MILALPLPTKGDTPGSLVGWLDAIGRAAQAAGDDAWPSAEAAAREALLARPAGPARARAELALGIALREAGRPGEAAEALRHTAGGIDDPALAAQARFWRAESLLQSGDPGSAALLFAETASAAAGPLARRARWREAQARLQAGSLDVAASALDRLLDAEPSSPLAPEGRLALARALRGLGQDARASALLGDLWRELPADPAGEAAGRELVAWRAMGGPDQAPTLEDQLARAERLVLLGLPRMALAGLDIVETQDPPREPASRSHLLRAFALLQVGRRDEAEELARAVESSPDAREGTRDGAALVIARAAGRAGRTDEALARYRRLASSREPIPGLAAAAQQELPDEARYLVARLSYEAGHFEKAARLLEAHARDRPRSRRAADARWFAAWSWHRAGQDGRARQALARLEGTPLRAAAHYWQARLAQDAAGRRLHDLRAREADPDGWYGLLAAGRLAEAGEILSGPARGPAAAPPDGPGDGPEGAALARAASLLGAGLRAEALAELRDLASARRVRPYAAVLAQLAEAAGDAELPFRMARDHLPPGPRQRRWAYPEAFAPELSRIARAAGADPHLLLAVLRRESAFRPDARSAAGAVGIAQLLPDTAARVAALLGTPPSAVDRLEDPRTGIALGATYLGLLASRFSDPALVLAAYNGGPGPAAAWATARAGLPLDAWVEEIGFRETRRYVKAVLADAAVYRWLWAGEPLSIDGARAVPAPGEGVAF